MSAPNLKDIVILVKSENAVTERRVTPSWSLFTLKMKLEPVTGIPPLAQKLSYQLPDDTNITSLEGLNEDSILISSLGWQVYTKLIVEDTRPPALRDNFLDLSQVEKYEMPEEDYAKLSDSVLAWKKRNQLGRFDPRNTEATVNKRSEDQNDIDERGIKVGARCMVGDSAAERRGEVAYVGQVDAIPQGGVWIGVRLDEPTGKNDGTIDGKFFFDAGQSRGIFVRPSRVTIGEYPPNLLEEDDLLEEI
ncbi:hypothetical protein TWF694_003892 [Orbilia ellipsospora]|uniref:CAP-Gly domain-containing protein n=1 Tax=Orbilia ellipsospora TaxID=2528407 RepID=A0AAV9WWC6_9PEZI